MYGQEHIPSKYGILGLLSGITDPCALLCKTELMTQAVYSTGSESEGSPYRVTSQKREHPHTRREAHPGGDVGTCQVSLQSI